MTQANIKLGFLFPLLLVAACGGSGGTEGEDPIEDDTFTGDGMLLAGTELPTAEDDIIRYDDDQQVSLVSYDPDTDVFTVNNLPFDGNGDYDRDNIVASLNGFNVYENNNVAPVRYYKALNASGRSGKTNISIVKSGSYQGFGFGGFVYTRDGSVTIPTNGQAVYAGNYAGLRHSSNATGIEYVTGDAFLEVDFDDLDASNAVEGDIANRQVFDVNGNPVTLRDKDGVAYALPTIILKTGGLTQAGEIVGEAVSLRTDGSGNISEFETGNYYAVMSGKDAEEIAGVIVISGSDLATGDTIQETGGFFAYD